MLDDKKLQELTLQTLSDHDPEYQQLVSDVTAFNGINIFPITGKGLNYTRNIFSKFEKMSEEEFFATFKCMVAWAVMIGKILDKIHGINKYDSKKTFNIYSSSGNKFGLIYYESSPVFYINSKDPRAPMYIEAPLKVFGGGEGIKDGTIIFKIVEPHVIYNPELMTYIPKLLTSTMEAVIKYDGKEYGQAVMVKNFDLAWLSTFIKGSNMGGY